jgi:hypothetical protein
LLRETWCGFAGAPGAPATPLHKQYRLWCDDAGEKPETQKMFGMRMRERGFENGKIKSGPHKDRKGWFGIGIRADHPDPEDSEDGDDIPPGEPGADDKGPLGGQSADHRPLEKSGIAKPSSSGVGGSSGQSGPKNQEVPSKKPREEKVLEKRSASSASSARDLTTKDVLEVFEDPTRGAYKNAPLYAAGEIKLDALTRSVLYARGMDTCEWPRYSGVVEEAVEEWRGQT